MVINNLTNQFLWPIFLIVPLVGQIIRFYFSFQKRKKVKQAKTQREKELGYLAFLSLNPLRSKETVKGAFSGYLNRLKEEVQWKYYSLWSIDEGNQQVKIRYTGYLPDWYMQELSQKVLIKVGDASIGRAIATRQPVTINLVEKDPRFKNLASYGIRAGYHCLSCYPLIGKLKTVGGFCAYGEKENMFTYRDVKFLLTCANFYAIILENELIDQFLERKTI